MQVMCILFSSPRTHTHSIKKPRKVYSNQPLRGNFLDSIAFPAARLRVLKIYDSLSRSKRAFTRSIPRACGCTCAA